VKPLGPIAYIIKARVTLLRDLGSALSPFNAFLVLQGLETLALRIAKHSENAQLVVDFLRKRPEVVRVIHPSVQTGVARERATRYLKGGLGGLVGFELAGGKDAGRRFIDALEPVSYTHLDVYKRQDIGTPAQLGEEMRRLRRRCRKIIWLNPLIGWRDYSPQARGMQAALPYVDLFAPAHNLESLAALEPYLARM